LARGSDPCLSDTRKCKIGLEVAPHCRFVAPKVYRPPHDFRTSGYAAFMMPNGPYPAITCLTGFLRSRGIEAHQLGLSILLITRLLSQVFLPRLRQAAEQQPLPERRHIPSVPAFFRRMTTMCGPSPRSWPSFEARTPA